MKKFLLPILFAGLLIVCGGVAARQTSRITALERTLEELCRSALSETQEEMHSLSIDMEKVLVSSDPVQSTALLHAISQAAGDVRRNLTFLPLSHEAMAPTLAFANQLADYAASLLPELVSQGALSQEDIAQLSSQLATCSQLSSQLSLASQAIIARQLPLMVENSVFSSDSAAVERPLEILSDQDNGMNYPTLIYDGPFSASRTGSVPRGLPTGEITQEEALTLARQFVGPERVVSAVAAPGTTGQIPAYGVTVQTADVQLNLEITRQGGKVLWMMPETASFTMTQSIQTCREAAAAFLTQRGFGAMEPTHHHVYDGLCVISFAALQDGVLLYPDLVKVQIRMDTAQPVGLEAHNYWINHVARSLPAPGITIGEAQQLLSEDVAVSSSRLCLVPNGANETLCYEFSVTHGDNAYLIYLDAQTGHEVEILKMIPTESGMLTA